MVTDKRNGSKKEMKSIKTSDFVNGKKSGNDMFYAKNEYNFKISV